MESLALNNEIVDTPPEPHAQPKTRRRLVVATIGVFFVIDSLVLSSLKYLDDPSIRSWADDGGKLATVCALIGVAVLLVQIVVIAARARRQTMGLNELVILAVLASIARASMVSADSAIALQTAGAIAFFMLISLIIESQSAVGAKQSLEALVQMTPGKARRILPGGGEEQVDPEALRVGDVLQIRPGETVYADGNISKGATALQEANITGESLPVDKSVGQQVFAGTLNLSGLIEVEVERAGRNTTLGKVRDLILAAEQTRMPFVRLIDRYIRYYTPLILMLALIVWFATDYDLGRVAALLVAACPVALILATPSATIAALSAAARLGILIKNVNDIESMAKVDAFILDKTGTVSKGELGVMRLAPDPAIKSAELLRFAASAEQRSNHPVAVAVRNLAVKARINLAEPEALHEEPGRGLRATVDGCKILVGNLAWMTENGGTAGDFPDHDEETAGVSVLYVMRDGKALGWIALEDQLRDEAGQMITDLGEQGVKQLALVTGDRTAVAAKVAKELGIEDFQGDCIPSEKVDYVNKVKARGMHVAFVGDGVNDGPALAASSIGIAMGAAGSDVAMESASIALLNNRLNRLPFLRRLAQRARTVIVQNFVVGGLFIFGGMALSAAGHLPPLAAAVIQVIGSLIVVMNSARLVREGEDLD